MGQKGVASMIVLILTVLIVLIAWEIGEYVQLYSETGQQYQQSSNTQNCIGSNTAYDCYDQDEGTDFVDPGPSERLIFGWEDDGQP